jgi:hypothetical protein
VPVEFFLRLFLCNYFSIFIEESVCEGVSIKSNLYDNPTVMADTSPSTITNDPSSPHVNGASQTPRLIANAASTRVQNGAGDGRSQHGGGHRAALARDRFRHASADSLSDASAIPLQVAPKYNLGHTDLVSNEHLNHESLLLHFWIHHSHVYNFRNFIFF